MTARVRKEVTGAEAHKILRGGATVYLSPLTDIPLADFALDGLEGMAITVTIYVEEPVLEDLEVTPLRIEPGDELVDVLARKGRVIAIDQGRLRQVFDLKVLIDGKHETLTLEQKHYKVKRAS